MAPKDAYTAGAGVTGPARHAFAIVPGEEDLTHTTRSLYVGTGGNLVVVMLSGAEVMFANVPNGTILPIRVDKILAEDSGSPTSMTTTASDIVGLY